jgi:hypothetical protein
MNSDQPSVDQVREWLSNRMWRLENLYYIIDKKGNRVLFKLNASQRWLAMNMWFFNIIPKARQLGITTFFCILYLDQVLWSNYKTAVIIAHTEADMKKIFRKKIKFAVNNLPDWAKAEIGIPNTDSANEMTFDNGSSISVALSSRSDTVHFLHVSEFGKICAKYPDKAEEIVSGAINSVPEGGFCSIESTTEGMEGRFFEFCEAAKKRKEEGTELTPIDFKLHFFPWYDEPEYTLPDAHFPITAEYKQYFDLLQKKMQIILTEGQMRWYIKKREKMGVDTMYREYPSSYEEAFSASVEGAYFTKEMERIYLQNRIRPLIVDPTLRVDTWWDLGMNDFNVIIFTQTKGAFVNIIDVYWNHHEGLAHYAKELDERANKLGYRYGTHHLPHDVKVQESGTGVTRLVTLYNLGIRNVRVNPRTPNLRDDIESMRKIFPRLLFDEVKAKKLADMLAAYRKEWDDKLAAFKDKPRHDEASHFADALRVMANLWYEEEDLVMKDEFPDKYKSREQAFFSGTAMGGSMYS